MSCPIIRIRFCPPSNNISPFIVQAIEQEKVSVRVQAFSFTSPTIAGALIRAKQNGIDVQVILDRENLKNKNSALRVLHKNGVPVFIDSTHNIAHNKIMIFGKEKVITGSANFSRAASETNAENIVSIIDKTTAEIYYAHWLEHQKHSKPYELFV